MHDEWENICEDTLCFNLMTCITVSGREKMTSYYEMYSDRCHTTVVKMQNMLAKYVN